MSDLYSIIKKAEDSIENAIYNLDGHFIPLYKSLLLCALLSYKCSAVNERCLSEIA